jgi:hypothetical protein
MSSRPPSAATGVQSGIPLRAPEDSFARPRDSLLTPARSDRTTCLRRADNRHPLGSSPCRHPCLGPRPRPAPGRRLSTRSCEDAPLRPLQARRASDGFYLAHRLSPGWGRFGFLPGRQDRDSNLKDCQASGTPAWGISHAEPDSSEPSTRPPSPDAEKVPGGRL